MEAFNEIGRQLTAIGALAWQKANEWEHEQDTQWFLQVMYRKS